MVIGTRKTKRLKVVYIGLHEVYKNRGLRGVTGCMRFTLGWQGTGYGYAREKNEKERKWRDRLRHGDDAEKGARVRLKEYIRKRPYDGLNGGLSGRKRA